MCYHYTIRQTETCEVSKRISRLVKPLYGMLKTVIRSLATASPALYLTQEEALEVIERRFRLAPEERELYRKILKNGSIQGRYFGMNSPEEALEEDQDALVARFRHFGHELASRAGQQALAEAAVDAREIGGLVVNTCTGYLCPGLSSYVAETLGLEPLIRSRDLMGMGCGAAVPNLETAASMLALRGDKPVLSIAVEVCSATMFMGPDPGLVVSNCIFGDGAAAAVLGRQHDAQAGPLLELLDFQSGLFPEFRSHLQYRTEKHRLRNVLGPRVPVLGARLTARVVRELLERNRLSIGDIDWWAVHPGGSRVLEKVGEKLGLDDATLRFSYDVFRDYGNMSSPSVLFVLKRILEEGRPQPGDRGLLVSFGAGFSAFAALVAF